VAVGIVVVSHSAALAEAAAELAREMAGPDLRLALAGGVDDPDAPLGTDAMRVLAAIEEMAGDDGVLVLMDLGSAVLSAELALELLAEEHRERVVLCDAPLVEGLVAAAVQAAAGAPMDRVVAEARDGLAGKSGHLGTTPPGAPAGSGARVEDDPAGGADDGDEPPPGERRVIVPNRLGLHARPAGRIVGLLTGHQARVSLENVSAGRGPVRADSLNAIITLGARQGHELLVRGTGADAGAVLDAIAALAETGFGDPPDTEDAVTSPTAADERSDTGDAVDTGDAAADDRARLQGRPAAPGLAAGTVHRLEASIDLALPERTVTDVAAERSRLHEALGRAAEGLRAARAAVTGNADPAAGDILEAQSLLLADPVLVEAADEAITDASLDAARAWQRAVAAVAASYRGLDDAYLAERAADVEAIGVEVLRHLVGAEVVTAEPSGVVVAQDLSPAETARLDPGRVEAVVTAGGSPTGHAALIARSLGIPSVVGVGAQVLRIEGGSTVVVDGDRGVIETAPDADRLEEVARLVAARATEQQQARLAAQRPAHTSDGIVIEVLANVGSSADADRAHEAGADGIGLLRSELLFLDRADAPDEHEQAALYEAIAVAMHGAPVVLRTLDVGGDKPLPYVPDLGEANPFLGVRGLRLALAHPERLLLPQLRAALRVAAAHPLRLMVPMVTTLAELDALRAMIERARTELVERGVPAAERLSVGTMVEVPALALRAEALVSEVDFVSIGTNDLTQYVLAAERGNAGVDHLADPLDPAVLRLIAGVCEAATPGGVPVAVCGGLASDPAATAVLIGLGVRELSVPAADVPRIKQQVRGTDGRGAVAMARAMLEARSAAEVRARLAPSQGLDAALERGRGRTSPPS
jgi:multiphosphoryl transfer protein